MLRREPELRDHILPCAAYSLLAFAAMADDSLNAHRMQLLSGVMDRLLADLKSGAGDKDKRRQVEEWMRSLAEKYPEFPIEAERLRGDFDKAADLTEKLTLARSIESFLDRAAEYGRRVADRAK